MSTGLSPESRGVLALPEGFDGLVESLGDRYVLHSEIGRGGMAVVLRAHDTRHGRDVAVKVMKPELAQAVGADRFLREIQIEARLQHPHIIPLHDSGRAGGLPYYVMPLVEGESLRDRVHREGQLPVEDALAIVRDVGEALSYAHSLGFVHRDIKPENILLSAGHALLADFGIARAVCEAGGSKLTGTGFAVGTPAYMSPEQAGGDERVDGRSDIYALGCVLYEMLVGEPPFGGRTPQAVIARHLQERPPSIEVVRPNAPPHIIRAIERALAKVPADRFRTVSEFLSALVDTTPVAAPPRRVTVSVRQATAGVIGVVAVGVAFYLWSRPDPPPLDDGKVVVFPLAERNLDGASAGEGELVALAIGAAFDHTEPLRWIYGWQRLDADERLDQRGIAPTRARAIARAEGARYYLAGAVARLPASNMVTVWLHDVEGDSILAQETATAAIGGPLYQLGLDAVRRVLPALVDPGRTPIDLRPLSEPSHRAFALWLQGERLYRESRFDNARDLYRRALEADSSLAFAAIKGAQAASWRNQHDEALAFVRAALARDSVLPRRFALFARGLDAYLTGRADDAVTILRELVDSRPWSEAVMALGEVYYHLLPNVPQLDSLARSSFEGAARDSGFLPPLFHLAEIAIRDGDRRTAERRLDRFRRFDPEPQLVRQLEWMLTCVQNGVSNVDWDAAVLQDRSAVLFAGKSLSAGARQPDCAAAAFRALLRSPAADPGERWGALVGWQSLLVALRRDDEAAALLDSTVAAGTSQAMSFYVLNTLAGAKMGNKAAELETMVRQAYGADYAGLSPQATWLMGLWLARSGLTERLGGVVTQLERRAEDSNERHTRLYAEAARAHWTLSQDDTAAALSRFEALRATARRDSLSWDLGEPLAVERLRLSELLFATGDFAGAHDVATAFDHPEPAAFIEFVPLSLAVRYRAAHHMGRSELASDYRDRLRLLGREDLLDRR
ncbi:MAG TPA: serine/threonine-protein kinase [Gemmatimonadales bacterium]